MRSLILVGGLFAAVCGPVLAGTAAPTSGRLFYTVLSGHSNVFRVDYSYDGAGHFTLGSSVAVADLPQSADGLLFAPNGDLLVGGQHENKVFQYTRTGTLVTAAPTDGTSPQSSFHLALDPTGSYVYSSDTYDGGGDGRLEVLPFSGGQVRTGTLYNVYGSNTKITSLQYTPYGWYYIYDTGSNGNGDFGIVDMSSLSSITTTRLFTGAGLPSSHSLAWDPYTNMVTLFGGGAVGRYDPTNPSAAPVQRTGITCDFDQGAVDGKGHALIAGCGQITFIDYSASHDITSAGNPTFVQNGYANIDDVAPLSFLGHETPEPGTFVLLGAALGALALRRRR